ncbi:MAG: tRNA1(Val) (adenine(37)-N6)-methyltransferase [Desulfamplus sp.]
MDELINDINQLFEIAKSLYIDQPDKGYRFSIDPFLLLSYISPQKGEQVLDIGTGCGIMPLILALKYPDIHITAVEIQSQLAEIARQNINRNGFKDRIELINRDIKEISIYNRALYNNTLYIDSKFDRIISNPPYKKKGSGRLNPDSQKAVARHEIMLTLDELIFCVRRLLKADGILNLIYPAARLNELIKTMNRYEIEPVQVKHIFTGSKGINIVKKAQAKLALITAKKRNLTTILDTNMT